MLILEGEEVKHTIRPKFVVVVFLFQSLQVSLPMALAPPKKK